MSSKKKLSFEKSLNDNEILIREIKAVNKLMKTCVEVDTGTETFIDKITPLVENPIYSINVRRYLSNIISKIFELEPVANDFKINILKVIFLNLQKYSTNPVNSSLIILIIDKVHLYHQNLKDNSNYDEFITDIFNEFINKNNDFKKYLTNSN